MMKYIYPVSGPFHSMLKLCQHFKEAENFDVLLTGNMGNSAIISWDDKAITYPTVSAIIRKVLNEPVTIIS